MKTTITKQAGAVQPLRPQLDDEPAQHTMTKPKLTSVPLDIGLSLSSNYGCLLQEKSDGQHLFKTFNPGPFQDVFNAEAMRDGSLVVNDVLTLHGQDVRQLNTRARWAALIEARIERPGIRLCRVGSGGEFLEALLAHGGEGIVAKPLDMPFGVGWLKCKRCETFDLLVTEIDLFRGSLRLADLVTGEDRGWCPARASFQDVKISDVVEVAAYGLTAKGKLREARFVRTRPDKAVSRR